MRVMRRSCVLVGLLTVLGCGRGAAERVPAADTTTVAPARVPAVVPAVVPAPPVDSSPPKAAGTAPVGRDSAFGPSFTVDSTGKVTPIGNPKKKP